MMTTAVKCTLFYTLTVFSPCSLDFGCLLLLFTSLSLFPFPTLRVYHQ
jgi:hypothetical protein